MLAKTLQIPSPGKMRKNSSDVEAFRNCLSPCLLFHQVQSLPFLKPLSHLSGAVILGKSSLPVMLMQDHIIS